MTKSRKKSAQALDLTQEMPAPIIEAPVRSDDNVEDESFVEQIEPVGSRWAAGLAAAVVVVGLLFGGFQLLYAGKVYPGVMANGAVLGGLSRDAAMEAMAKQTTEYQREVIPVQIDGTTISISPSRLGTQYDAKAAVETALAYGRGGSVRQRLWSTLRVMAGQSTQIAYYGYDDTKLTPYIRQLEAEANQPVVNAALDFADGKATVKPAQPGRRLDSGLLVLAVKERLASGSHEPIQAPVYELAPAVTTADLEAAKHQADDFLRAPLKITFGSHQDTVEPAEIIPWIALNFTPQTDIALIKPESFAPGPSGVKLGINDQAITAYVASLAKKIDQPGQDAALTINEGRAAVFRPSRDGIELNQTAAVAAIRRALVRPTAKRDIALEVKVTMPSVTEESLNNLGINELLSEGVSYFPGSARERIQNVRVGASRFNGVLIKPGETFSFNAILGDVGPETGYAPARVILKDRQEIQYGGGLCQVSSTAFRAALNAGLPITARINHSYVVPYYTQPYGVPGVDATIYLPNPDFKFVNDTGAHILIQTVLAGTTLKFQFYGTKTKEGNIRGPFFVSGSLDATQPSRTVFYRDIIVNGQVTKTDTFHSSYKSSNDFPLAQFN
jgi:vancomycin resistance protein YoaR